MASLRATCQKPARSAHHFPPSCPSWSLGTRGGRTRLLLPLRQPFRRVQLYVSLTARQTVRPGLREPHEVFEFQVIVQLAHLLRQQARVLLSADQIVNPLPRFRRRLEVQQSPRCVARGDEIHQLIIGFGHAARLRLAAPSASAKPEGPAIPRGP